MARGELVGAIAMTEPAAGSDLQGIKTTARRDGDHYVINGSKTFITNGWHAGIVCLAVKTDPKAAGPKGISLIIVETENLPGYQRRPLAREGRHARRRTPASSSSTTCASRPSNLLGPAEGKGFSQMMEQLPLRAPHGRRGRSRHGGASGGHHDAST